ncbi:ATP synthase subunit g, mitochondrial-like [Colias croceus]|uniref:ATP synthase subunit g, mitochondrial-like n=1 Tax=Colias crocea TaxID=72248 RepID=UPI001E27B2A9|nr:ATP synthase subunit g, mitochondrial-like [Colias croceus]
MVAGTNVLKLAINLLRIRTHFTVTDSLPELHKPYFGRRKEDILKSINDLSNRISTSEIARKMRIAKGYYTLEISPPKSDEMAQMKDDLKLLQDFFKTGSYKHLTVKQAWLLFLVSTEVGLWFFLGETIGKMHIVGYKV